MIFAGRYLQKKDDAEMFLIEMGEGCTFIGKISNNIVAYPVTLNSMRKRFSC